MCEIFCQMFINLDILNYIEQNYIDIEKDMNQRNSTSKRKQNGSITSEESFSELSDGGKTRKKREELSVSACKCIKKESVKIVIKF